MELWARDDERHYLAEVAVGDEKALCGPCHKRGRRDVGDEVAH